MPTRRKVSPDQKPRLVRAKVLSSKTGFKSPLFTVVTEQVREPGGYIARRDIVHHPGSVVIMALEESMATPPVLLEHQYRPAARGFLWELPAGKIDRGEQPLKAAQRELLEETGYSARRWRRILDFFVSPGFLDETMAVFLARDIRAGAAQPEPDELIENRFFSLRNALAMIESGAIRDAKTISSLLWLALHQKRLEAVSSTSLTRKPA
jgi:ADP-ribose pyrophosphatase